jgi:gluconolactonase
LGSPYDRTVDQTSSYPWDTDRTVLRFPDPAMQVLDDRFRALTVHAEVVQRLWTGGRWLEGPVWFGDGRFLLFSDIPNNRILRWSEETGEVTTFRAPADHSNGNSRDRQGRLITCEHLTRRVTRTEHDGRITVLLDSYHGKPLNAPNDLVAHSDSAVWFTDPAWGIEGNYEGDKARQELPRDVYRIDPTTGEADVVISEMDRPNGICFSPDESLLYVVDTDQIRAFDIVAGRPVNGRVFVATVGWNSDGIRCDRDGNLWAAAGNGGPEIDGVHCYHPDGTLLGKILLPETCANLCFGGIKKNRLFMTASRSLYSVYVEAFGAQTP